MKLILSLMLILTVTARECEPKQNGAEQKINLSEECKKDIDFFNQFASEKIIRDIKFIYNKLGRLSDELMNTYPAGSSKWNSTLSYLKSSYSGKYIDEQISISAGAGKANWQNAGLADYELFFHWLMYYRWGDITQVPSMDMEAKAAWIEQTNIKKRVNSLIKARLIESSCFHADNEEMRKALAPRMLPTTIEACLN